MIYLYLKESPKGLKYIGKTINNPYDYMGSGIVWKNHIKKYKLSSSDIKTTILFESDDSDLFKKEAIKYSKFYNIVDSNEFANLTEEQGQGGITFNKETHPHHPAYTFSDRLNKYWSDFNNKKIQSEKMVKNNPSKRQDVKDKLSKIHTGKSHSIEHNKKKGRCGELNVSKRDDVRIKISEGLKGRKLSDETKQKIRETLKRKHLEKILQLN
jgi:hypothetical protein